MSAALALSATTPETPTTPAETTSATQPENPAGEYTSPSITAVRVLRAALARRDRRAAEAQFAALWRSYRTINRRWANRITWIDVPHPDQRAALAEDLQQELALFVWSRLSDPSDLAWEHWFHRSLLYAQGHIADVVMRKAGFWSRSHGRVAPKRGALVPVGGKHGPRYKGDRPGDDSDSYLEVLLGAAEDAGLALIEDADVVKQLWALTSQLKTQHILVLELRYRDGLDVKATAHALSVSVSLVRYIEHRALDRLRVLATAAGITRDG